MIRKLQNLWNESRRRVLIFLASIGLYGIWVMYIFKVENFAPGMTFLSIFIPLVGLWYSVKWFIDKLGSMDERMMKADVFADASGAASAFMAFGTTGGLALGRAAAGEQYIYLLLTVGVVSAVSWLFFIRKVKNEGWSFLQAHTSNIFSPHVQAAWVSTGVLIAAVAYGFMGVLSVLLLFLFLAYGVTMVFAKRFL